ncbi:Uncharacterised protein [uncultured archaeon]|nr:Uncharacterised protein [uncultured archaeon]
MFVFQYRRLKTINEQMKELEGQKQNPKSKPETESKPIPQPKPVATNWSKPLKKVPNNPAEAGSSSPAEVQKTPASKISKTGLNMLPSPAPGPDNPWTPVKTFRRDIIHNPKDLASMDAIVQEAQKTPGGVVVAYVTRENLEKEEVNAQISRTLKQKLDARYPGKTEVVRIALTGTQLADELNASNLQAVQAYLRDMAQDGNGTRLFADGEPNLLAALGGRTDLLRALAHGNLAEAQAAARELGGMEFMCPDYENHGTIRKIFENMRTVTISVRKDKPLPKKEEPQEKTDEEKVRSSEAYMVYAYDTSTSLIHFSGQGQQLLQKLRQEKRVKDKVMVEQMAFDGTNGGSEDNDNLPGTFVSIFGARGEEIIGNMQKAGMTHLNVVIYTDGGNLLLNQPAADAVVAFVDKARRQIPGFNMDLTLVMPDTALPDYNRPAEGPLDENRRANLWYLAEFRKIQPAGSVRTWVAGHPTDPQQPDAARQVVVTCLTNNTADLNRALYK